MEKINVEELRKGSLIVYPPVSGCVSGCVERIGRISDLRELEEIDQMENPWWGGIKPVGLSEEAFALFPNILKQSSDWYVIKLPTLKASVREVAIEIRKSVDEWYVIISLGVYTIYPEVEYMHQLQNLCLALTGVDL